MFIVCNSKGMETTNEYQHCLLNDSTNTSLKVRIQKAGLKSAKSVFFESSKSMSQHRKPEDEDGKRLRNTTVTRKLGGKLGEGGISSQELNDDLEREALFVD